MVREAEDGGQYEQQADGVHADWCVVSQLGMSGLLHSPATTETGTRWPDCRRGPGEDWGQSLDWTVTTYFPTTGCRYIMLMATDGNTTSAEMEIIFHQKIDKNR